MKYVRFYFVTERCDRFFLDWNDRPAATYNFEIKFFLIHFIEMINYFVKLNESISIAAELIGVDFTFCRYLTNNTNAKCDRYTHKRY